MSLYVWKNSHGIIMDMAYVCRYSVCYFVSHCVGPQIWSRSHGEMSLHNAQNSPCCPLRYMTDLFQTVWIAAHRRIFYSYVHVVCSGLSHIIPWSLCTSSDMLGLWTTGYWDWNLTTINLCKLRETEKDFMRKIFLNSNFWVVKTRFVGRYL